MYYNAVFVIAMYILGHVPLFDLVFIHNIYTLVVRVTAILFRKCDNVREFDSSLKGNRTDRSGN